MAQTQYTAENPFELDDNEEVSVGSRSRTTTGPPLPSKTSVPPTLPTKEPEYKYNPNPSPLIAEWNTPMETSWEGVKRKEMELSRREEDLDRRERALLEKEETLPKPRINNWPRCKPFLYHNIPEDIPTPEGQKVVSRAYYCWYAIDICFVWNLVCTLAVLSVGSDSTYIGGFFLALALALFWMPVTFLIYRLLYGAARKSKPAYFVLFFIFLWLEILVFIWMAIGISGWGGGGFFLMLAMFDSKQTAVAIMCLVCFIIWVIVILWCIYLFIHSRFEYRKAGSLKQAKADSKTAAAKGVADQP